jgi:hypothetical protein
LSRTSPITNNRINLLNFYGPCTNRQLFWEKIEAGGLLDLENLIIVGDLNLTTTLGEIWGASATQDPLADFFTNLFSTHHLVDFAPDHLTPTRRNGRVGSDSIAKRLDRFLISEHYTSSADRIRTWVGLPFLSDHAPIIWQLDTNTHKFTYPFKLNSSWLTETEFNSTVSEVWQDPLFLSETCIQHGIVWKLETLKSCIKSRAASFRQQNAQRLQALDSEIRAIILAADSVDLSGIDYTHLKDLEEEINQLLLKDEITWRQRCRLNWVKSGDLDTIVFNKFASACRNKNYIWEIPSEDGRIHKGQHDLKVAAVNHFQPFFEQNTSANLQTQVSVARLFTHSVTGTEAHSLDRPCSLLEISIALKSFSKDKSPGIMIHINLDRTIKLMNHSFG